MIIKNPKFEISVMNKSQYPKNKLPEIVLAGKSNVGKSSFVNDILYKVLANKLNRAKTIPGKFKAIEISPKSKSKVASRSTRNLAIHAVDRENV